MAQSYTYERRELVWPDGKIRVTENRNASKGTYSQMFRGMRVYGKRVSDAFIPNDLLEFALLAE